MWSLPSVDKLSHGHDLTKGMLCGCAGSMPYGGAVQSATLKVAHSTLLVVCSLIAAQMPAYLSLENNERLLRHII